MIWTIVLSAVAAYCVLLSLLFVAMCQSPVRFGRLMRHFPMAAMTWVPFEPMWNVARKGATRVGGPAPDFALRTTDRQTEVRLSTLRGKPVVLVFGSYT